MDDPIKRHEIKEIQKKIFSLLFLLILLLSISTFSYVTLEGWNWVDSLYFSTAVLVTRNYGEFIPVHAPSKIFTILFVFTGYTTVAYTLTSLGTQYFHYIEYSKDDIKKNMRKAVDMFSKKKPDKWVILGNMDFKNSSNKKPKNDF